MEGRRVRLLLTTGDGVVIGWLAPYPVASPWWSEVASVVEGCRAVHGAEIIVLRLLEGRPARHGQCALGGDVSYVAQLVGPAPTHVTRSHDYLGDEPLRARWARPGGPTIDLMWADEALARLGRPRHGAAVQTRTWNLSSIWRLPTQNGDVWFKAVPDLCAHEGAVMHALRAHRVPRVLAFDGKGRALLEHVPGENQYRAELPRLRTMVELLVDIQTAWLGRSAGPLALGLPDWRRDAFVRAAEEVMPASAFLDAGVRRRLDRLVEGLHRRFTDLDQCGLPETVVHGDAHPGNFRSDGSSLVLIDWADCGVGHPLLDRTAFSEGVPAHQRDLVQRHWIDEWSRRAPGSDPGRAARLVRSLGALRNAVVYARLLRTIEPSERCYHEQDVPRWLAIAASLA